MIVYESVANPWSVFVRDSARGTSGLPRALGHGLVVGRRVFVRDRTALSYEVLMEDGSARSCSIDQFWNPENISRRIVGPSPLHIPAPPVYGARTCP